MDRSFSVRAALVSTLLALMLPSHAAAQAPDGASVFASSCAACHQATGAGLPGAFPPLAGHAADIARLDGGRAYLTSVVLFGLQGQITVDEQTYNGVMPAQGQLSDEQVAAVLTYVTNDLGEGEAVDAFDPATVAEVRATSRAPSDNLELRSTVIVDEVEEAPVTTEGDEGPPAPFYTDAQAQRVQGLYRDACAECHGERLNGGGMGGGAPLRGAVFENKWSGRPVSALYDYLRVRMPQDRPGSLTDRQYADLVALILRANDYPPGSREVPPNSAALREPVFD